MYPPKVVLNPRFGKLREICRPFFDLDPEKWKPQVSQQIARHSLNLPTTTANHAKSAQFPLISNTPCSLSVTQLFTPNHAKSAQFANPQGESRDINQIRTNFNYSSIFAFQTFVRQDPTPCLCELRNFKLEFAKSSLSYPLHNIPTFVRFVTE